MRTFFVLVYKELRELLTLQMLGPFLAVIVIFVVLGLGLNITVGLAGLLDLGALSFILGAIGMAAGGLDAGFGLPSLPGATTGVAVGEVLS